jgi:hypothetical protein
MTETIISQGRGFYDEAFTQPTPIQRGFFSYYRLTPFFGL